MPASYDQMAPKHRSPGVDEQPKQPTAIYKQKTFRDKVQANRSYGVWYGVKTGRRGVGVTPQGPWVNYGILVKRQGGYSQDFRPSENA